MTSGEPVPVVVCAVGEQHYAILVADILEVAALVQLTPLPEAPPELVGVVNRRGEVLPILDLRLCLGQQAGPLDLATLFVVVQAGEQQAGLIVDDVLEVTTLPAQAFRLPAHSGPYVRGMATAGQQPLLVLDVAALLQAFAPVELPVERQAS